MSVTVQRAASSGPAATLGAPYPGPRPFQAEESELFFGRRRETADLANMVLSYPAVLLYSRSGAGKTSLINTSLRRRLLEEGVAMLPVARVSGELPPGIDAACVENIFVFNLLTSLAPPGARITPSECGGDLARALGAYCGTLGSPPDSEGLSLLVVDQFEELFRSHPERWADRPAVCEQIAAALRRNPTLRLLLVIREDHLADLDPLAHYFPDSLRIRYRLEGLREAAALDAIVQPAAQRGHTFEPGVAESIVRDLRQTEIQVRDGPRWTTKPLVGEFVEPVHLQVVCQNLWTSVTAEVAKERTVATISAALVRTHDVNEALADFYARAVSAAAALSRTRESTIRAWVEERLITPAGTRGIVYQAEHDTCGLSNSAVDTLEKRRVIRAEPRAGAVWYELTHDRFIGPIRASNRQWRERRRAWWVRAVATFSALGIVSAALGWVFLILSEGQPPVQAVKASDQMTVEQANLIRSLTGELVSRGHPDDLKQAVASYQAAASAYERAGQKTAEGRVLLDRARVLVRLERQDEAINDASTALELYNPNDKADAATLMDDARGFVALGTYVYERGPVDKAVPMLRLSLNLMARVPDHAKTEEGDARTELSLALARGGQYLHAHDEFTGALETYRASGAKAVEKAAADQEEVIARAPLTTQAYENLTRLYVETNEPWKAIQTIDRGIQVAETNRDPILQYLRLTRRIQLQAVVGSAFASDRATVADYFAPGSTLGRYLCARNAYVVAASEHGGGVEITLRRFRPQFPLVFAGPPAANGWYPIIVDAFVSCDEARAVLEQLHKLRALDQGAFVGQVLRGCGPPCEGLPTTVPILK